MKPEVISNHICELGEGPVWDSIAQVICWLDIVNGKIHEWSPMHKTLRTISIESMIGSMAICTDRNYVVAMKDGFGFIDRTTERITKITDPEKQMVDNRFNDGKCDPAGRFWAGTMSLSEAPKKGSLYTLDLDGNVSKKVDKVTISNGLAWSPDHKTFYFIDTPTLKVLAYDYNKDTSEISNKRAIITIAKNDGYPDGMTIDNEGMLWIAHWDGWQVTRWNPITGEKLSAFKLPVARVTSCAFGGETYQDLYITSAKIGLSEEEIKKQPLAGSLFVIRDCGYKGTPAFEFNTINFKN